MTRTEHLEQSWRNLEADVQSKLREISARTANIETERRTMSLAELTECAAECAKGVAYASILDLIHTAMRELGLPYD